MNPARLIVLAALTASCAAPSAVPPAVPVAVVQLPTASVAEFVQARQAGMHMMATMNAKGIVPRAKGQGDLKDTPWSEGIEMFAAAIPGLFPPGTLHPQSRAKPEIWANKADFDAKARNLGEAAHAVTVAGQANDLAAYSAAAARLGEACSACHTVYRGPPVH